MTLILDGKIVRAGVEKTLKADIAGFSVPPKLAIVQIGNREDSNAYIAQKKKCADSVGAHVDHIHFDEAVRTLDVVRRIEELNKDENIHGIILQLPVPSHIDPQDIIEAIDPRKDVDGLTSKNLKLLWTHKESGFVPATAKGILSLLDYYKIPLVGKKVVVVGRSVLVGKPVALLMLNRGATVTICHSGTLDLKKETILADILIIATGKENLIGREHVCSGQVVIDVGINVVSGKSLEEEIEGKKLVGDVDFEKVKDVVSAISPVPGGVGPMTVISLFENLLKAYHTQVKS